MDLTLPEGAITGTAAFAVVPIDGSRGACLFGTVAAALADGSTPDGLRATAASFVRRRPHALVQFGAELRSVAELAALLAAEPPLVYARELARKGTWGDALALAVLASLHGLRAHVLLPRGRAELLCVLECGPREGRPLFARLARNHYELLLPRWQCSNASPLRQNAKARRLARRERERAWLCSAAPRARLACGLELLADYTSSDDDDAPPPPAAPPTAPLPGYSVSSMWTSNGTFKLHTSNRESQSRKLNNKCRLPCTMSTKPLRGLVLMVHDTKSARGGARPRPLESGV